MDYLKIQISESEAKEIAIQYFGINGEATILPGEIDFNFRIKTLNKSYILKVSRPDVDLNYLHFQDELLRHLETKSPNFDFPKTKRDSKGQGIFDFHDQNGLNRKVRLLEWIDGELYSNVSPRNDDLRYSLGFSGGQIANLLSDFDHNLSKRTFDWDIANGLWVEKYLEIFDEDEKEIIIYFLEKFKEIQPTYNHFRKSTIHNDANDNNIIVDENGGQIKAIIDYGDAVYSQIINDLSVTLAYACLDFEQPLISCFANSKRV